MIFYSIIINCNHKYKLGLGLKELGRVGGGGEDAGFVPPSLAPDPPLGLLPVGPPPELEGEEEGGSGSVSSDVSSEEEGKKVVSASIKAACYKVRFVLHCILGFQSPGK